MSFKPIGKWISIKFRPPQTRSKAGLYLVTPEYSQIATIIAIGEQVKDVKVGDVVMVHKYSDAMITQSSLWYYYLNNIIDNPDKVKDFEPPMVVVSIDDVFGGWDDKTGLIPTKKNVVFKEFEEPEMKNGVIRFLHHRSNRWPSGEIIKVSSNVKNFKPKDVILLGRYGGAYFTDIDGVEKVLVSTSEILGTLKNATKNDKILVGEPRERFDNTLKTAPLPGVN